MLNKLVWFDSAPSSCYIYRGWFVNYKETPQEISANYRNGSNYYPGLYQTYLIELFEKYQTYFY